MVDGSHHRSRTREAARGRPRAAGPPRRRRHDPRAAAVEGVPLPLLRLAGDEGRGHPWPDAVPLDPLVRELPPAVRAVQDDLRRLLPLSRLRLDTPLCEPEQALRPELGPATITLH